MPTSASLGSFHEDRLFDEINGFECLIAHKERRQERRAGRRSWWSFVIPTAASVSTEVA